MQPKASWTPQLSWRENCWASWTPAAAVAGKNAEYSGPQQLFWRERVPWQFGPQQLCWWERVLWAYWTPAAAVAGKNAWHSGPQQLFWRERMLWAYWILAPEAKLGQPTSCVSEAVPGEHADCPCLQAHQLGRAAGRACAGQCSVVPKPWGQCVVQVHQGDFITDLYDTLCPGWVDAYQWIGDKRVVTHSMNGLCTGIGEECPEQLLKSDYSAMTSLPDLWLLSVLLFLGEFEQLIQAWIAQPPDAMTMCEAVLHLQYDFAVLSDQSDNKCQAPCPGVR